MKRKTNAVLDEVLRRERQRKVKRISILVIVILFCGAITAYSIIKQSENMDIVNPQTPPPHMPQN